MDREESSMYWISQKVHLGIKKKFGQPNIYLPPNFPCLEAQIFDLCLVTSSQFAGSGKESKRVEEKIFPFPKGARK